MAQYPSETPPRLVEQMMKLAAIRPGMTVLEPCAGRGALAIPARAAGGRVECVELNGDNIIVLRDRDLHVTKGDFFRIRPEIVGKFDRVILNPPFHRGMSWQFAMHAQRFVKPGGFLIALVDPTSKHARGMELVPVCIDLPPETPAAILYAVV